MTTRNLPSFRVRNRSVVKMSGIRPVYTPKRHPHPPPM